MKLVIFMLLLSFPFFSLAQENFSFDKRIGKEALQEDYRVLWEILNNTHPALFKYTSKEDLHSFYKNNYNSISERTSLFDFYLLVKSLIVKIRCVHTGVNDPIGYPEEYILNSCQMLPFNINYINKKAYIIENLTYDSTIFKGSELISINGLPIQTIIDSIFYFTTGDGFIDNWKIWFEFGKGEYGNGNQFKYDLSKYLQYSKEYSIIIKDPFSQSTREIKISGITHQENIAFRKKEQQLNSKRTNSNKLNLSIDTSLSLAILKIGSFYNPLLKKSNENFINFVKKSFKVIEKSKVKNLVIDLRNNNGGATANALLLYSYLTDKKFDVIDNAKVAGKNPFPRNNLFARSLPLSTNPKFVYNNSAGILCTKFPEGERLIEEQKPAKNSIFKGKVIVLINGGTSSASIYFNYAVLMNKRGHFIGQEQGGNVNGCPGWDNIKVSLPNSSTTIEIPLVSVEFIKIPGVIAGPGLIPDYLVSPSIEDILTNKDPEMNLAVDLISTVK